MRKETTDAGGSGRFIRRGSPGDPWAYQQYEVLYTVVIEEGLSRTAAAEEFDISPETLDVWIRRHGLEDHPDLFNGNEDLGGSR